MSSYSGVTPLDANVLEPPVRNGFAHFLDFRPRGSLLLDEVVWALLLLHAGVDKFLQACADEFVRDLVVLHHQLMLGLSACSHWSHSHLRV